MTKAFQCPHDLGHDTEIGPLGCRLNGQNLECVCLAQASSRVTAPAQQPRKYDMRALAKFLYEHCALDPDKAGDVAATLLEEYNIWPDDFAAQPPAAPVETLDTLVARITPENRHAEVGGSHECCSADDVDDHNLALLKIAGAISQLQLAEESTSDEVTRRHLREIYADLQQVGQS